MRWRPTTPICSALGDTLTREFLRLKRAERGRVRAPCQRLGTAALRDGVLNAARARDGRMRPSVRGLRCWPAPGRSMALVGSYVGLSKLLVAVFPVFLLAWLRFGIAARGHGALGAPRARGDAPLSRARPQAAVLGELPRQLPVLDLHAVRRGAELRGGRGRDHGGHPGGRGAAVARLPGRAHPRRACMLAIGCAVGRHRLAVAGQGAPAQADASRHRSGATCCCSAPCSARPATWSSARSSPATCRRGASARSINLWGLALVTPLGLWQALALRLRGRAAADVGPAAVLFGGRQHGHRVAVDDRACAMCRRRRPACSR